MAIRFPVHLASLISQPRPDLKKSTSSTSIQGEKVAFFPESSNDASSVDSKKNLPTSHAVIDRSVLEKNDRINAYLNTHASDFMTPEKEMSEILSGELKHRWNANVDPDNTYLVTFKGSGRTESDVVEKVTLTQATLKNRQDVPIEDNKNWFQKVGQYFSPMVFTYNKVEEAVESSHTEQGIYRAPTTSTGLPYSASTRLDIPVADFKALIWDTDRTRLYKNTLSAFWEKHTDSYTALSKLSYVKAVKLQSLNGSLGPEETKLALRVMGPFAQKPWTELDVEDFTNRTLQDPSLDIGLVSVNGMKSTDLLCVTDKKTRLTLLYIPGNSSPLHRFDNPEQMGLWLAKQAADPLKRAALMTHFSLGDQADKVFSDGVHQSLQGLGAWSEAQESEGFSFSNVNDWSPERYIKVDPLSGDPFQKIMTRQMSRSFSDADNAIVSDSDYTKTKITQGVEEAAKVALFMTPLALVMPEVALALDAFYLAAGSVQAGIGIDDVVKGKSTGADRIVFGVLNAMPPLVTHGGGSLAKALKPESEGAAQSSQLTNPTRPFFKPPQRVNGQIGYPMGPVSPPAVFKEFSVPLDGVRVSRAQTYSIDVNGYSCPVVYDLQAEAWRGLDSSGQASDVFHWREHEEQWLSGTREQLLASADKRLASVSNKVVKLPGLPLLPLNPTEVPKVIHYFWAGNEMPEHLIKNIIENARKSPGYQSIVHVDANDQSVFLKVKQALDHKVGGLEVRDLKADESFRDFNTGEYGEMYQYFRSGQRRNLAASSDVMRAALMKRYGGIYMDTDDVLTIPVGDVSLKAAPNEVLMSSPVTYEPADFSGFNNSNFASHAENPVFDKVLEETYRRFKASKEWLDANRPFIGENPTASEREAYKAYEKKIFEVTGPHVFNAVMKQEKMGLFPVFDDLSDVTSGRLVVPQTYLQQLQRLQEHYWAMDRKFGVDIGGEHSMRHSR
ncbi:glycosyltransferase family 32 protein [Pseudomonas sp. MPB26]|uniref:glycosyltransferase family 32 protein n=1 Tax=Pseudomonas sp. MPB26 TaxID=3388491 RepID=UPI0039853069